MLLVHRNQERVLQFVRSKTSHLPDDQYDYLDLKVVFRDCFPLNYTKIGNLVASSGTNESLYNATECENEVFRVLYRESDPKVVQFFLSMPMVFVYEIEGSPTLPFVAKQTSNTFGKNLHLDLDARYLAEITDDDMKLTLYAVLHVRNRIASSSMWLIFSQPELLTNPSESDVSACLRNLLRYMCAYLSLLLRGTVTLDVAKSPLVPKGTKDNERLNPDFVIYHHEEGDDHPVCVVEIKKPTLFPERRRANSTNDDLCDNAQMKGIIIQLQSYMLVARVRFGLVSDGIHLILCEFDEDYEADQVYETENGFYKPRRNKKLIIPSKVKILNIHSTCPTFLEGLLYFLAKSKDHWADSPEYFERIPAPVRLDNLSTICEEDSGVERPSLRSSFHGPQSKNRRIGESTTRPEGDYDQQLVDSSRFLNDSLPVSTLTPPSSSSISGSGSGSSSVGSSRTPLKILSFEYGAELIQRSKNHMTCVYKIKAKYLKDVIFDEINDNDEVIVKIYDPYIYHDEFSKYNGPHAQRLVRECYLRERKAVTKLLEAPEYNSIYLRHKEVEVRYWRGYGRFILGRAIISRFIDGEKMPMTVEVYDQVRSQLTIIHQSGIIHGDVREANFLWDGRVYVFDFSHSEFEEECETEDVKQSKRNDVHCLNEVFHEIL